ncbi:MAG: helicase-exonuclease AddAB subunit AddA [Anaerobutyricum sp.]|nr:helicase-exonuclease AddAB subunit AddA [Anaerobutyricum sp.]
MNFTKEQEQAVFLQDCDIMVCAGAGAGKTRVLVNRMAEMILDEKNPVEADEFLVMTFTNAAAAEMKERIGEELEKRLSEHPEDQRLKKQIRKLKKADISTVHSFCNHLIRSNYSEIGVDPSFRIGEEGELFLLRKQSMEELLEESYQSGRESFYRFVEAYAPGKSDEAIEKMIESLYQFTRGFPGKESWALKVKEKTRQMAQGKNWDQCPPVRLIVSDAKKQFVKWQEELHSFQEKIKEEEIPERMQEAFETVKKQTDLLVQKETYEECYDFFLKNSCPSFPRATKKDKDWIWRDEFKQLYDKIREGMKQYKETVFTASSKELQREASVLYPLLEEYIFLAFRFEEIYFSHKKEKNIYDFDDLEHFAIQLLVESFDEEGKAHPSEIARNLSHRYKMIFVDEYQDTSLLQETLIEMIRDPAGNNLFTVGDVKQSIYSFRQARPDLFIQRADMHTSPGEESGRSTQVSIELRDNFRSAPGVLAFTNYIFSNLMEREFGGVDYDERTALRPGKGGPMETDPETSEALFFIKAEENAAELPDDILLESAMIAERIKKLVSEGYQYGEIVILIRSGAERMEAMEEYFTSRGIPASCEKKTGYFHTREISLMMNYLAIVDNVYQDIPMASVMLSSIGGFREEELVQIRMAVGEEMRNRYTLYDLMRIYLAEGKKGEIKDKIQKFLGLLLEFREEKKEAPLGTLLWDIFTKTGYFYEVALLPDGEKRKENLLMLLKKAEEYEKTVFKGLFYFNRYMEQMKSYEVKMGEAGSGVEEDNVVRIMTIHKSKGLEFPVVFVCGLQKNFNVTDLNEPILCHPEMGVGMECVDTVLRMHHPSLMKKAIRKKKHTEMLEEEMRILYVAMTRAKKKLILSGIVKQDVFEKKDMGEEKRSKRTASSVMDWVLPLLSPYLKREKEAPWLSASLVNWEMLKGNFDSGNSGQKTKTVREAVDALVENADASVVEKSFSYEYPNRKATKWKRKYSVSELKTIAQQELPDEEERLFFSVKPSEETEKQLPSFLKEKKETMLPSTRGTIVHKVMELLPFEKIDSPKQLLLELKTLETKIPDMKKLSGMHIREGAEAFLFSRTGEKIRKMAREGKLKKELPFTVGLPVSMLNPQEQGKELVVIQGVIDVCAEDEKGLWLLDYKTDHIREGEEGILLDRYKNQMLYYKAALEQITEKKVVNILIYSFSLKKFLPVIL